MKQLVPFCSRVVSEGERRSERCEVALSKAGWPPSLILTSPSGICSRSNRLCELSVMCAAHSWHFLHFKRFGPLPTSSNCSHSTVGSTTGTHPTLPPTCDFSALASSFLCTSFSSFTAQHGLLRDSGGHWDGSGASARLRRSVRQHSESCLLLLACTR